MINHLIKTLENKRILILGFGIEGKSTYSFLRNILPNIIITIADSNSDAFKNIVIDNNTKIKTGEGYIENIINYDIIIKSPGIALRTINDKVGKTTIITSQTELFLSIYSKQIIGITGTKGKSTTSSLIYHILNNNEKNAFLVGNIGTPAFDIIDKITPESIIVFEFSAHQLENIKYSPSIAIILNIFQEHLDYFSTFENYKKAKFNIINNQESDDIIIYSADNNLQSDIINSTSKSKNIFSYSIKTKTNNGYYINNESIIIGNNHNDTGILIDKDKINITGTHNLSNILAAIIACYKTGLNYTEIIDSVYTFKGLPHRLEYAGEYKDIKFYNDSISTIPESAIEAIKSLKIVDTIILGGFDRKIDYELLIDYISTSSISNIIFTGDSGKRMNDILIKKYHNIKNIIEVDDIKKAVPFILKHTKQNHICLLSPASASYDVFKNFEERGDYFKEIITKLIND